MVVSLYICLIVYLLASHGAAGSNNQPNSQGWRQNEAAQNLSAFTDGATTEIVRAPASMGRAEPRIGQYANPHTEESGE